MTIANLIRWTAIAAVTAASAQEFTNAQREDFLRTAEMVSRKGLSMGITNSSKAELSNGSLSHAAHIQTVNIAKSTFEGTRGVELNFRDSYKYNIAAYELSKILGINMIPPSVERKVGGDSAAVTWWVDNAAMTELDRFKKKMEAPDPNSWNRQMHVVRAFDELIYNTDRNLGNLVITKDWQIWMIDHTRAFRMHKTCPKVSTLRQIDGTLLKKMRELQADSLTERIGQYLNKAEIAGILARRDQIVKHFDTQLAQKGNDAVLFELGR